MNEIKDVTINKVILIYSNLEDNFKDDASIQKLNPKQYEELEKLFRENNKRIN